MPRRRTPHQQRKQEELSETSLGERQLGTVVTRYGAKLDIEDEHGQRHRGTSRRKLDDIVCGDKIIWQANKAGEAVVVERLERTNLLSRPNDRGHEKSIAANINHVIVISVVKGHLGDTYQLNLNLIDHYLVAAEHQNITPVLVFNKVDLLTEEEFERLARDIETFKQIGYEIIYTSTKSERGLEPLEAQLKDNTSIFVGESGVGKSSLINKLLPEINVKVGEISELSGKGKHTTTTTMLYHLPCGGELIDSPGVREFGLMLKEQISIARGFREFQPHLGLCKFNNCSHMHEPGCVIMQAVESGKIEQRRYNNYRRMVDALTEL